MSTKRTDKILAMLDDALQSTTPNNIGMPSGNPDLCVCCQVNAPVRGRSWCELCLPEASHAVKEADPYIVDFGTSRGPVGRDDSITANPLGPTGDDGNLDDDEWEEVDEGEIYEAVRTALNEHLSVIRAGGAPPTIVVHDGHGELLGFAVHVNLEALGRCTDDFHTFLDRMEVEVRRQMEALDGGSS